MLCFYLLGTYFLVFNIMRQCFACALLLFICSLVNINKPTTKDSLIFAISILLIGIFFHPTILIFYIYFLYHTKIFNKLLTKKIMIIFIIISFIIFYTQAIIPFITSFIDTTSSEGKLINYAVRNIQNSNDSGFSPLKISLITIFQIYLIASYPNIEMYFYLMGTLWGYILNCVWYI